MFRNCNASLFSLFVVPVAVVGIWIGDAATANAQISYVPLYTVHGDSADDEFGGSVSGAGDVNGDGMADFLVGATDDDNNGFLSGSARVFSGVDGSVLYTFNGDRVADRFGISVSGAGDVNGDGRADVIVGANTVNNGGVPGFARVFSGMDGSVLHTFEGDSGLDEFGIAVSGAGDVNGDGRADLIVGAFSDDSNGTNSGFARVLSGIDGSTLYTFNGNSGNRLGQSVSSAGDINGDGHADLIVGAPRNILGGVNAGSVSVISGIDGSTLYDFFGNTGDQFGGSVSEAGDVNGDGVDDLIVGAFDGYAQVISGIDGSTLYTFTGDDSDDAFGRSVSGVGDINGDGWDDLIVGAGLDDNNGANSGSARLFSGFDGSTLFTFDGDNAGDIFGRSVSGIGDVNGDGLPDFVVGSLNGGANDGGYARVFVSAVPEPGSLSVLLATSLLIVVRRRRSRRPSTSVAS